MSERDLLERARVNVRVIPDDGTIDDVDRQHLTGDQVAAIQRADHGVREWLAQDPDREEQLLVDPLQALSEALGEPPSDALAELLVGPAEQEEAVHAVAAAIEPPRPAPLNADIDADTGPSLAGVKAPRGNSDVTFMVSLDALADAYEAATAERLLHLLSIPASLNVPNLDVPVRLELTPTSTRPLLGFHDERVHLLMVFRGLLRVAGVDVPLDDIVMRVPLDVQVTPPDEGLAFGLVPDADAAIFGSPSSAEPEVASLTGPIGDVDIGELFPDLEEEAKEALEDITENLDKAAADIRSAVTEWLTTELLEGRIEQGPILALTTDIPQRPVVCEVPGPTALDAAFRQAEEVGTDSDAVSRVDALVLALGYGRPTRLPDRSFVPHGFASWVELSNQLLLDIACCLVPETFRGLPADPTAHRTDSSCRWEGGQFHDAEGTAWDLEHVEVSCTDSLTLDAKVTRSGFGHRVTVTLRLDLVVAEDGQVLEVKHPEIDVDISLKWWARITLAVIFTLVFGLAGGGVWWAVGGAVGIGVVLLVEAALEIFGPHQVPDVLDGLEDPLRLFPPELTGLLGQPVPERTWWDDLEAAGGIRTPDPVEVVTRVPDVRGLPEDAAVQAVRDAELEAGVSREFDDTDRGTVFRQLPSEGSKVEIGSRVAITVSKGPSHAGGGRTRVPDVTGKSELTSSQILREKGYDVAMGRWSHSDRPFGEVLDQRPDPGTAVQAGSTVTIFPSKGPRQGTGGDHGGGGNGGGVPGGGGTVQPK